MPITNFVRLVLAVIVTVGLGSWVATRDIVDLVPAASAVVGLVVLAFAARPRERGQA